MNSKYTTYKLPVNWETGMMLNQTHLNELNDYMFSIRRNSMLKGLHYYNYGLLPDYDNKFDALKISLEKQSSQLIVQLEQCYVLTFDGFCFNINPQTIKTGYLNYNNLSISIDLDQINQNYMLIYLSYNPDEIVNIGHVDVAKDDFERKPYRNMAIKLNYSSIESVNQVAQFEGQGNSIPLAIVNITNADNPQLEKKYIPPCVNFYSDERLSSIFEKLKKDTNALSESMTQVLSFVREDEKDNLVSNLTLDLSFFLKTLLPIVAEINAALRSKLKVDSIIELFYLYKKLATTFIASFDSIEQTNRREMANYFAEMHGTPNQFSKIGLNLVEANYVHVNVYKTCLEPILQFVDLMLNLMKDMASKGLQIKLFSQSGTSEGYKERKREEKPANTKPATAIKDKNEQKDKKDDNNEISWI